MTEPPSALESRLIQAYAAQASCYERALEAVEQGEPTSRGEDWYPWIPRLQTALNEAAAIDAAMAEDKQAWRQSGRSASAPLRAVLDLLAEHLRVLAASIDGCVAVLSDRRRKMVPELDGFIQQRRMRHAYDQHGKPAGSL
jgi:hypothetical protein